MLKINQVEKSLKNNPKKWLVTGAAGFIGSHLVERLLGLSQKVIAVDNLSTGFQANIELFKMNKNFSFLQGDIRDLNFCIEASKGVDYILHQAALGSVPRSIKDPLNSHLSNVDGTLNIFESCRINNISKVVYASSSSVYGDSPALPKKEQNVGNPLSPYAATKKINEIYASVYSLNYDISSIGLRYFNVFGPRQNPEGAYAAVIPRWFSTMIKGEKIQVFGDGETSRDFTYIDNIVDLNILSALSSLDGAHVLNGACHRQLSLNGLFGYLKNIIEEKSGIRIPDPEYLDFRKGDVRHSLADTTRARDLVGYVPRVSVEEGLSLASSWYYENL